MSSLPGSRFVLRGNTCGTSEAATIMSGSSALLSTVVVLAMEVGGLLLQELFFPLLTFLDDAVDFCLVVLSSALLALSLAFFSLLLAFSLLS